MTYFKDIGKNQYAPRRREKPIRSEKKGKNGRLDVWTFIYSPSGCETTKHI